MLWKRQLEEIALKLTEIPPAPWRVSTNGFNQRVVQDANGVTLISMDGGELSDPEYIRQWHFIEMYVLLRNNCELWFDEMKKAGISDIVLPKKKKRPPTPFVPVPATPSIFNINDVISVRGEHYECKRTPESE